MRTNPRRKDRTLKDPKKIEALLGRMAAGRLGLSTEDGSYVVPINCFFAEGSRQDSFDYKLVNEVAI